MIPDLAPCPGGYLVKVGDGYQLQVHPQRLFRLVEVLEAEPRVTARFWCYTTFEAAVLAGLAWEMSADSDPAGWIRRGGARV